MPTVRERVVQQAGTLVIAPICEAHFQDTSDGVRPQRRAHQAVKAGKPALIRGGWVVDADLHPDCDTIDHTLLVRLVARRISARRGLKLLRQGLNGGVVEQGQWQPTEVGAPHGGVGSPLLANLSWHGLDRYWGTRDAGLGELVRYAEDLGMIGRTQRQAAHA
jgi:RNA-directed DNA polymerase